MTETTPDTDNNDEIVTSPVSYTKFPRRNLFKRVVTGTIGGLVALLPAALGLAFFLDPLGKRKRSMPGEDEPQPEGIPAGFIAVASKEALPDDGTPQFFRVIADRMDGWTYFPDEPIGSVFLRKESDGTVIAFNSICPHAGCAVDYRPGEGNFFCPCHNSRFTIEGERSPSSPSPRDLDELETRVEDGTVWVKYQDFRAGTAEREQLS